MALYAFDGTWQNGKEGDDPQYRNTNVFRFFQAYNRRSATDDLYVAGIGTRYDVLGRIVGGAFGVGELARIDEAYDHLCRCWAAGDQVIDIIGFSRGAATTLDFCHCLMDRGVRAPGTTRVVEPEPRIRFLGVWDVVAAFGLANLGVMELNIGHHLEIPKSRLQYCFHALAMDERRPMFLPTRLPGAYEVWFRGVHSDVGGGNQNRGLNDIALQWMLLKGRAAGLPIAEEEITALKPDPSAEPKTDKKLPRAIRLIAPVDRGHYTVGPLDGWASLPPTCGIETRDEERAARELGTDTLEVLPIAVRRRIAAMWEAAEAAAGQLGFSVDPVREPLLTLFQGRVPLVTNDDELRQARRAVVRLVEVMVAGARERTFHTLSEFFLNEALFKTAPLWPLTD